MQMAMCGSRVYSGGQKRINTSSPQVDWGVMNLWDFIVKYWLEVLFAAIVAAVGGAVKMLYKQVKKYYQEQSLLKEGVLAILHDRLYQECSFLIAQEHITAEGLRNLEYLYRSYHALGGNGTGTELYLRCKKLPIKK